MEGPRVSGPWLGVWGGNANVGLCPTFKLTFRHICFRVGLCPTHFLPFAGDVDARQASNLVSDDRMASIARTRVHAIIKSTCVLNLV